MQCLDNRRLVAQNVETHICISVLQKAAFGRPSGWSNGEQARPFKGKRGALVDYHDNMVVPELLSRGFNHKSPLSKIILSSIPLHEQEHRFWSCITWDMVLRDCRHLLEKWYREEDYVDYCEATGKKTRIVRPQGHNPELVRLLFHQSIHKVFHLSSNDEQGLRRKGQELLAQPLLTAPFPKQRRPRKRHRARV